MLLNTTSVQRVLYSGSTFFSVEWKISQKERPGLKYEYYVFIYTKSTIDLKLIVI